MPDSLVAPASPVSPDALLGAPAGIPPDAALQIDPALLQAAASPPESTLAVAQMFLNADPVVQAVMGLLLLASLIAWVIILEKAVLVWHYGRRVRRFMNSAANMGDAVSLERFSGSIPALVKAGLEESRDHAGGETRADYRERVERAMRGVLSGDVERVGRKTLFLATVATCSPFIGLFGTVWGIMHSFAGIAASGETTLAVVAPGIAEALFATAMGLVAAIPAVIGYNRITASLKRISRDGLAGIAHVGNRLGRLRFAGESQEERHAGR